MPKKRQPGTRKLAKTLRVESVDQSPLQASAPREGWLLVVVGAQVDLGHHVVCDRPITVGRDPVADLTLSDGSISREHCSIERDEETGRYMLVDLGSTNGTRVNETQVSDRIPLTEGDKIYLGASVLRFSFADKVDIEYHERIGEMATTDPLTGMASKWQYDAVFAARAGRAAMEGTALSVMVMDMDGLKQINDSHGHEMGGFVIAETAKIIRSVLDSHGLLCRFGGDEFVGCFPGLDHETAMVFAQEVRDRVCNHSFKKAGAVVAPTISIGLASFPHDTDDPHKLFTAADRALYKAKRSGRNRVAAVTRPVEIVDV